MPILDANILIRAHKGDQQAKATLEALAGTRLLVPAQSAFEFVTGTFDPAASADRLDASFEVEYPTPAILRLAASLAAGARRDARIHSGDAWIAAHAKARGDYVVSTNKRDFTRLGVACWNYEKEKTPPSA